MLVPTIREVFIEMKRCFKHFLKIFDYHQSDASLERNKFLVKFLCKSTTFSVESFTEETKPIKLTEKHASVYGDEFKLQIFFRILGPSGFWCKIEFHKVSFGDFTTQYRMWTKTLTGKAKPVVARKRNFEGFYKDTVFRPEFRWKNLACSFEEGVDWTFRKRSKSIFLAFFGVFDHINPMQRSKPKNIH